jgi:acyl-homoserine lactone acylase PvdQ
MSAGRRAGMYGPPMRRALLVLLVASGVGLLAAPANAYQAQISTTSYGVPHVRAHGWGGLGFGAGYAYLRRYTVRARR